MSLCRLSPKSVRKLNRQHGTDFMWASAHHSGLIIGVRPGGKVYELDRHTGRLTETDQTTSSLRAFGTTVAAL